MTASERSHDRGVPGVDLVPGAPDEAGPEHLLPFLDAVPRPEPATPSLDERHAAFVQAHVAADPAALPRGAADEVDAVVEHLHAVVEVLDVIETVEAEGRSATDDELARLEHPGEVLAASTLPDPRGPQPAT